MGDIEKLLRKHGPSPSSKLVKYIVENYRISETAARKRISRACSPVEYVRNINLKHRERFIYLKEQFADNEFLLRLEETLKSYNTAEGRLLYGLDAHGGIAFEEHLPIISGLPDKMKKHRCYNDVKGALLQNKLIYFEEVFNRTIIRRNDVDMDRLWTLQTRNEIENSVLTLVKKWLIKMGFSSQNTITTRKEKVNKYGPFQWDLVGASFLQCLVSSNNSNFKNGFIVADILIDKTIIKPSDLIPFLFKCQFFRNQKKYPPCIFMHVGDRYQREALNELRKNGIIVSSLSSMFNEEIAGMLRDFLKMASNIIMKIKDDPDKTFDLLHRLVKWDGASLNLRSAVIELIISKLYMSKGYYVKLRKIINTVDGTAEIDVFSQNSAEIVCIECKGLFPGNKVAKNEIEKWLDDSKNIISKWLKNEDHSLKKRFEFYISGAYEDDAQTFIQELENKYKKVPIKFFDGKDIIQQLADLNEHTMVNIFKEHFTKNPL